MKPWLWIPTKLAHDIAPMALNAIASVSHRPEEQPFHWRHLKFRSRFSIAGGVDKNAQMVLALARLGAGFIEIGTVTPEPQEPNPGKIMDRDIARQALWNKMGFPNDGAEMIASRLELAKKQLDIPVFVNIGKNRWTENEDAAKDYIDCAKWFSHLADVYVINISSPNTKGLRNLQTPESVNELISGVAQFGKPVLLKLSPDLNEEQLFEILEHSLKAQISGWILTNTTLSKENVGFTHEGGGVSGAPLKERSRQILQKALEFLNDRRSDELIVSVGGITTPEEARHRIEMGADLVQTYSGLIYYGHHFFRDCVVH